jgi:spermidine/putrescine-binding protein
VSFSGEASEMLDGNEHLHYVVPSKGSNLWFDNMVIPKSAKNIDGAYAFMSFMLRPENALRNAEYVGYSTPIPAAKAMLDEETQSDEAFYPSEETMKQMEVYDNLGKELLGTYMICTSNLKCIVNNLIDRYKHKYKNGSEVLTKYLLLPFLGVYTIEIMERKFQWKITKKKLVLFRNQSSIRFCVVL